MTIVYVNLKLFFICFSNVTRMLALWVICQFSMKTGKGTFNIKFPITYNKYKI